MAFTRGRYQSGALRGPQRRRAPLNGITMAGAEVKGLHLVADPGSQRPGALGVYRSPDSWTSSRSQASPNGLAHRIGQNSPGSGAQTSA